jgi:raffinose/stachyose/melibiose transport system substrate-binding protein
MNIHKVVKSALAMALSGAMITSVAACGGENSSSSGGKVTVSYLSWNNEQVSKPFIDEFEKENPNIHIDFSYSPPTAEYIQTLQTRLVGNQAPDVFVITSENKADLMKNGYAKDLTNEPFMKNISQANKDFVSQGDKVYGMSTSSWASGIVYNKALLKKVGVTKVPSTWDGFLTLCKKLKNAGITPYLETIADGASRFPDSFLGSQFAQKGIDVTTLANNKKQTPGKDSVEAVKEWIKLYDQGLVTRDAVGVSGDDMKSQFTSGQVAMICTGPWDFGTFQDSDIDWGYAQMPAMKKGMEQYAQGSPSPALTIYSKLSGEKLKAAEKFMEFMQSDWALKQQSKSGDAITVKGFDSDVVKQYQDVYDKDVKTGKYFLISNYYSKPDVLNSTLQSETQQLVQGSETVEQWADAIDQKMASAQ